MTERDHMRRFAGIINTVPGAVLRTLPDSGIRGHKKPYDGFLIHAGRHYSIEAKIGPRELEPHQVTALAEDMDAGAGCFVLRFSRDGFTLYGSPDGGLNEYALTQTWKEARENAADVVKWLAGVPA